jgi:hypothetical protein
MFELLKAREPVTIVRMDDLAAERFIAHAQLFGLCAQQI